MLLELSRLTQVSLGYLPNIFCNSGRIFVRRIDDDVVQLPVLKNFLQFNSPL